MKKYRFNFRSAHLVDIWPILFLLVACGRDPLANEAVPTAEPSALPVLEQMLGPSLVDQSGTDHPIGTLHGKLIGLYFAAQWDPPSCYFTRHLIRFYEMLKQENKAFEVVLISDDRSAKDMQLHLKELNMPWLAVPLTDGSRQIHLKQQFAVLGLPVLIIMDDRGQIITTDGRADVMRKKEQAYEVWR
ncbi:MAG: thioredoxin-like domain-containing protein [Kiritimatiellae bacterium]|nr:thioredoxin-like domain-containing protein [Kiritimatiellia bacterium]